MKILQVITLSSIGGAQNVVINLANLMCRDHEVMVVSNSGGSMWDQLDSRVEKVQIPNLLRAISPLNDLKTVLKLKQIYKQFKPSIIHLHSSKAGMLGRIAFPKDKIIYTVHGFDSIRLEYRRFLPIEKLLRNRVKAIVGVSNYDYNNLKAEGISKNIVTIYNGVSRVEGDSEITIPFNNSNKNILAIARGGYPKDFALFKKIAQKLPQYNFTWIGNNFELTDLPDNLICMGEIVNASRYYALGDLAILTSNYEGLPVTIIEALSVGKPVVASRVGGVSEIVIEDVTGYTIPDKNLDLFVTKITAILENSDLYSRMSNNAIKLVSAKLSACRMVEQYYKIYNL